MSLGNVAKQPAPSPETPGACDESHSLVQDVTKFWSDAAAYLDDWAQRSVLFWDVMRQRGNQYLERQKQTAPNVLSFAYELMMDGRGLPRPVNYMMVRILPPAGVETDREKRPFVVIDPRAGHGPGIGGFKADSEIGVALQAGHPCYFIGFLPDPVAGQTIEDVCLAEATFLEHVIALHPDAEGKPTVIGNCQAGWAVMMLAAARPELFGPIIIAGAPLSYWNGVHGTNPMRYTGGLVGGSWTAALASDLGHGTFDGAWLVENFENLNLANTLWTKQYNLFSKIDTEAPRYLEFEKWWNQHVRLTGAEIQFIIDKLFVGNKLISGDIVTTDGTRIDLRAIRSPIIVFCSKGDNITPPQQALGWILDLYGSTEEIRMYGQTIVYAIHESVGHLGIFVSGAVARKEHEEFASNIDLIDVLPPGLYEAVLHQKAPDDANPALAHGDFIARFEERTLDHIRTLGGNDYEDERRFATVARLSEINYGLYRMFVRPWFGAWSNEFTAETLRRLHPLHLQYEFAADTNPLMRTVASAAEQVRRARRPAAPNNLFLAWQDNVSHRIVEWLDGWQAARDGLYEQMFLGIYGSSFVQSLVGEQASGDPPRRKRANEPLHVAIVERQIAELKVRMTQGGIREAAIRVMLYVTMADAAADERTFAVLRQIRAEHGGGLTLAEFKAMLRDQFFMLLVDEDAAIAALPVLAQRDPDKITDAIDALRRVLTATGPLIGERANRLARIERLFGGSGIERLTDGFALSPATRSSRRDGRETAVKVG